MAAASETADREVLKNSPFSRGEWPDQFDIDVGYDRLCELFQSDADAGFASLTSKHLLAVAYAAGQHERLLVSDPETMVQQWETELDARSTRPMETGAASERLYNEALSRADTEAARGAVKLVKAMDGAMGLIQTIRNLPTEVAGDIDVKAFPRLQKLVSAGATASVAKLRMLAERVDVRLPALADGAGEAMRTEWVWSLALLSRSVTLRAVAWLAKAYTSDEHWSAAVAQLSPDGRFTPEWMTERRGELRTEAEAGRLRAAEANAFDANTTPQQAWAHVSRDLDDAGELLREVAKAISLATVQIHRIPVAEAGLNMRGLAVGKALLATMRQRRQALSAVPVMPNTTAVDAEQVMVDYFFQEAPATSAAAPELAAVQVPLSTGTGRTTDQATFSLSPESIAALRPHDASASASSSGSAKITLGKAPNVPGSKRPDFFAARDVVVFQKYEKELVAMHEVDMDDQATLMSMYRQLPERARQLLSVPVHTGDLGKNPCLNVLAAVTDRVTQAGDDIITTGTVITSDRGSEARIEADRERAKAIARLRQGDLIRAGPQICVVEHRLESAYDFCQIPYLPGKVPTEINGDWDAAWFLWAEVATSQLGAECEIGPAVELIVKTVRQIARSAHVPWSDQERADFPAVALYFFTRDYRMWREGWPGYEKPSLMRILECKDFRDYQAHSFDYANKLSMRPNKLPYNAMVLGSAPVKRKAAPLTASVLLEMADGGDGDEASESPKRQRGDKKKKKKPKTGDPPTKPNIGDKGGAAGRRKGGDGGGGGSGGGGLPPPKVSPSKEQKQWKRIEGAGSAWPSMEHRLTDDQCSIAQSKVDVSNDIDKGVCVYCFLGDLGCKADKRVGVIGRGCDRAHSAPKGSEGAFCRALAKTCGLQATTPLYFKNKAVWVSGPSSQKPGYKPTAAQADKTHDGGGASDDEGDASMEGD